jgi:hypothetical protein
MRHVIFFRFSATKLVNQVYNFTQIVAPLHTVFQFAEYLADFIFNRIDAFGIETIFGNGGKR